MSMAVVTVALPVRNGGPLLAEVLAAVCRQEVACEIDLLVCDSGSNDGSIALARRHGARVIEIEPATFSHGGTRNMLMREAAGSVVAFLTQDATPSHEGWLGALLEGFALAEDVALVHGPFVARPDHPVSVQRELAEFFTALAPDHEAVVDRATPDPAWRDVSARATFFTDANGAVARWAWQCVPFPEVAYAEDRLLARKMLEAGFAKVYKPDAAVLHSHAYGPLALLRRYFDEFRGLRETFGHVEPADPRRALARIRREVAADRAWVAVHGPEPRRLQTATLRALRHHTIRAAGAYLGSRSDRLPPPVRKRLSLEGRDTFEPATSTLRV
jgi:glycosyltransferase involved in cell wall biosynthesis